jgi:excisionase family DNA binding protein
MTKTLAGSSAEAVCGADGVFGKDRWRRRGGAGGCSEKRQGKHQVKWRAIQDSNLWPSAPEALSLDVKDPAAIGNPARLLQSEHEPSDPSRQVSARFGSVRAPAMPPLLTVREVAAVLRVCTALVYRACARGELRHVRVGAAIRVPLRDLDDFIMTRVLE